MYIVGKINNMRLCENHVNMCLRDVYINIGIVTNEIICRKYNYLEFINVECNMT